MYFLLIAFILSQIHAQTVINPCGDNAHYTGFCAVGCATCAKPTQPCITPRILKCSCINGYVRYSATNDTCVAVNSIECRAQRNFRSFLEPAHCGANEQFIYCGICGYTCAEPNVCGRCVCLNGYLRSRSGDCIRANSTRCLLERPRSIQPIKPILGSIQ